MTTKSREECTIRDLMRNETVCRLSKVSDKSQANDFVRVLGLAQLYITYEYHARSTHEFKGNDKARKFA